METKFELKIKQDILQSEQTEFPNFLAQWQNPDPEFLEDYFDHLQISELKCKISDVKTYKQDNFFVRELNWTISFQLNSIDDLKAYLSEESVLTNGEFDGRRFIFIFAGNLEEIEIEDEENDDVVYVEVAETDVTGNVVFI